MSTILFYPIADNCSNGCLYCFEDPLFKKDQPFVFNKYDKNKMAETVKQLIEQSKESSHAILHGGEVLGLPLEDLEFFFEEIKRYGKGVSIQTSLGVPLTPEHIRLFKAYNVTPGISVDGPREFNVLRGPRNPEANKKFQDIVYDNIQKLRDNNIPFGTITILSKANASPDKIDSLIKWSIQNTSGGRFNVLFTPSHSEGKEISKYALTPQEFSNALMKLLGATVTYPRFNFKMLEEIKSAFLGDFKTVCWLSRCDYLTTKCSTVLPDGHVARCDRCFQDGYYYAANKVSSARWEMLEQTECKGCKYFVICAGGCPAEGINGDFRSKTAYCESYYILFQGIENMLRKLFPGIFLTIDVHNYYEEYAMKGKRFNPFVRYDGAFNDTLHTMDNKIKLLGWTPESEGSAPTRSQPKHGVSHADTNTSSGCGCGK